MLMEDYDYVTIICPTYNEEKYISNCINSILKQDWVIEHNTLELLIIDGMSTDLTRINISNYCEKYGWIKIIDNPQKTVPHALNKGIINSQGNIIIRIDAHCFYPENYISTLVNYLKKLNADNVGGLVKTLPAKDTYICNAIAIAMSHPLGVGSSLFRIGTTKIQKTDTVPFGCFDKKVFKKYGLFDIDLVRNQDDEFNGRIIKNNGSIYIIPEIVIDYYARDSIKKTAKMFYQYGLYKPLVNKKLGSPATLRQFVPLLFVLGLIFGTIFSFFDIRLLYLYITSIVLYFILIVVFTFKIVLNKKKLPLIFILPITFLTIHLSYGWGYLKGLNKIIFNKNFSIATSNR